MQKIIKHFDTYAVFYKPELLLRAKPFIIQTVQQLSAKYGINNPPIIIKWNNHFRTVMGAFENQHTKGTCWLEFNTKFILGCMWDWNNYGQKALLNTVKHEACHFVCYTKGLHYRDGQDDFEKMLAENQASSSSRTAYTHQKSQLPMIGYHYSKPSNVLIIHIDDHKKLPLTSAKVQKMTKAQKETRLKKITPILYKLIKQTLIQIGGKEYDNVKIKIEFNGRLRKTTMNYDYYKNNGTTYTAIFNTKQVLMSSDISELTLVIQKAVKMYLRDFGKLHAYSSTHIIG